MTTEYTDRVKRRLNNILESTDLNIGKKFAGKVRDVYDLPEEIVIVTTDRLSAFDRKLTSIPYKGQVLNQTAAFWFEQTKHICPNHIIAIPDPNVIVCKKCTVFPVEVVVRGYATGSTATSLWTHYSKGERKYCGHVLPEGLKKDQKLPQAIVTPTTKSDEHDELISSEEIISKGLMTEADWKVVHDTALKLFAFGQHVAAKNGMILVDTKYEFGKDAQGNILLIDEIHTPDSSRYWIASSYEERFNAGQAPESVDKDIVRNWYRQHCDPYKDEVLPKAPEDLIILLAERYINLYERITGQKFEFPSEQDENIPVGSRVETNLKKYYSK
jgi:phosphoribosylaminoimidazole-succinocarboxamide synthase